MLSLTECPLDFQYNALWDTHWHALFQLHAISIVIPIPGLSEYINHRSDTDSISESTKNAQNWKELILESKLQPSWLALKGLRHRVKVFHFRQHSLKLLSVNRLCRLIIMSHLLIERKFWCFLPVTSQELKDTVKTKWRKGISCSESAGKFESAATLKTSQRPTN